MVTCILRLITIREHLGITVNLALTTSSKDQRKYLFLSNIIQTKYGSRTRMDMNDEDAPPTVSLHDTAAWAPSPSNTPHFKNGSSSVFGTPVRSVQQSNTLTPNAPPTTEKPKPHFLTIFGYPVSSQTAYTSLSKSFSSMATGDIAPPEADENGGNWFTIGYYKQADTKRALARDGEIVRDDGGNIRYMIGVRWRDSRSAESDFGASGSGSTKALIRAGGFSSGSPLQPASAAFRRPEPPKANAVIGQGVAGAAGISPSKSGNGSWISSVGDMIFGW
jgi:nuclear pore complex protein Nup53